MTPEAEMRAKWPMEAEKEQEGSLLELLSGARPVRFWTFRFQNEGTLGWFFEPSSLSSFVSAASGN